MQYVLLAACCLLAACGNSDDDQGAVTVHFDHAVAAAELAPEAILYTNAAGNEYGVTRLEYIVSDIALETASGQRVELAAFHYRNAFLRATRSVSATVPGGPYTALRFTFGLDEAQNETGALPSVDHFNNMAWPAPMGGGYHYMRMEGLFRRADGPGAFLTHTGPTGGADFSFVVELPLVLTVSGNEWEIAVVMDLNEWYDAPFQYDFDDRGGIMGNADAQWTLRENGATVFSLGPIGRLDRGKFKTPTLRNVEYTAPYMHDGRFQTLEEVVAHYDSGFHRTVLTDPLLLVRPNLDLDPADIDALVAFLKTLSDPQLQAR